MDSKNDLDYQNSEVAKTDEVKRDLRPYTLQISLVRLKVKEAKTDIFIGGWFTNVRRRSQPSIFPLNTNLTQ